MKGLRSWKDRDISEMDSEDIQKLQERRRRWYMYARIMRIVMSVIWIIACVTVIYHVLPYATGKETLEDPMSNSQIQGLLTVLLICYAMMKVKL